MSIPRPTTTPRDYSHHLQLEQLRQLEQSVDNLIHKGRHVSMTLVHELHHMRAVVQLRWDCAMGRWVSY